MNYYIIKVILTALLIVVISEIGKRSNFLGALLASIPIVSVIAMIWLYVDTKDVTKISEFSINIFWLVIPSLVLFLSLPIFLKNGVGFYLSLTFSIAITAITYFIMLALLKYFGINL